MTPGEHESLGGLTESLGLDPAEPDHDPLEGRDLGGVTLEAFVAEGGMGRVYRGWQHAPRRVVAVKVIRPGFVSQELCRRFDHEAEVLGRLRHPGIAQIYAGGASVIAGARVPFIVMEYVADALPVTVFAERNSLSIAARLDLFQQVCEAVAHGHESGVVHRDIKPTNILVDCAGQPKVIDFGVARSVGGAEPVTALTDVGQLIGTVQYMSPEQFAADSPPIDARVDVYALGVVLYELLTGRPPYGVRHKQIFEAAEIVRRQQPVPPSRLNRDIPADIETVITTCLQKNPARRYASATALLHDLRSCSADGTLGWRGWLARRCRWRHDSDGTNGRWWLMTTAIGVGVVAAVLAAATLLRPPVSRSLTNTLGMKLVRLSAGGFTVDDVDPDSSSGMPANRRHVQITRPFWMGEHEVTQGQWKDVMGTSPWLDKGPLMATSDAPAVCVSWSDAVDFCRRLTARERAAGTIRADEEYRLPTEAEWEYACRAGSQAAYAHGDEAALLGDHAWVKENSVGTTGRPAARPVGTRKPNAWGLYDMHGNAWEWVLDAYGPDPPQGADPVCRADTDRRILRGGSWFAPAAEARASFRHCGPNENADNRFRNMGDLGFRVVLGRILEPPAHVPRPEPPSKLIAFRGSVEKTLEFDVVGHDTCPVWGSNPYTDDSCLATAAVHSGAVKVGERGRITITLLPGAPAYPGSEANGVPSLGYGPWSHAFRIEPARVREDGRTADVRSETRRTRLVDLPIKRSLVGWGELRAGAFEDIRVNGEVPASVIVAHAPSIVVFDIPADFRGALQGSVGLFGLGSGLVSPGSCRFSIRRGDEILWQSGIIQQLTPGGPSITEPFSVDVSGSKTLTLEVDSLGANHSDWSVWIDPQLIERNFTADEAAAKNRGA